MPLNMDMGKKKTASKKANTVLMNCRHLKPTVLSYICMFLGLGWMITVPLILIALPLIWKFSKVLFTILSSIVLLSAVYTADRRYQPSWGYRIGDWMMRNVGCYFQFIIEFEDVKAIEEAGPAIFVMEPHGVLPVTIFWGSLNLIASQKLVCCLSSTMFKLPLMKHFLTWCGATNADKDNIIYYLQSGYSVNICAGGVQEIRYWGNDDELVLFLKTRLGVTKLALTNNVPLVPSITFGLKKAYDCWIPTSPFLVDVGRKLGFFPMLFCGVGGVPFGQPKPCPLTAIIGTPIKLPHITNPTNEEVEKYHRVFLQAFEQLYLANRAAHGMAHVPLRIE